MNSFEAGRWCWTRWRREAESGPGEEGAGHLRTTLNSAEQRLANLVIRGPSNQSPAQYQALLADVRREKEVAERALAEHSADARAELSRAALGIEDVQRALPSGGLCSPSFDIDARFPRSLGAGPS